MIVIIWQHERTKKHGRDRKGNQRFRCLDCGTTWIEDKPRPLGNMRIRHEASHAGPWHVA